MANRQSEAVPKRPGASLERLSDGQLLERFNAHRDESAELAFGALVRRHGPMVLRVCHQILGDRHNAEDAFQATFLVLARRSDSIQRPELLGNWLYGVALRTAWEAKMRDGRRQHREATTADGYSLEPTIDAGQPELTLIDREELEALHEEVSRLPDRYRVPVVLCELEGLTYQEVANRMRCPVSTIGVRIARAKERLRARLIRRGIVPAAALTDAIFGGGGASALMSPALVDSTVKAASGFAASEAATSGLVSATVVALTEAVLRTMALARLKMATSVVLVVGLTAGVGWVGGHREARAPLSTEPSTTRPDRLAPPPAIAAGPAADPTPGVARAGAYARSGAVAEPDRPDEEGIVEVVSLEQRPPEPLPAMANVLRPVREELTRGEVLFFKEWVANDPASPHGDGLGPVYNQTSCVACHGLGAPGGAGPESKNVVLLTAVADDGGRRIPVGLEKIHPGFHDTRSTVLHRFGTDPKYGTWRRNLFEASRQKPSKAPKEEGEETVEARMTRIAGQTAPGGRAIERASRLNTRSGVTLRVSERNTPALFGAGRIDSIPSEVLIQQAESQPKPVRGRVSRNREGRVGRFGWKAQIAGLHEFVRVACAGELGLEVPGHSQSISPLAPLEKAKGLDLTEPECDALVAYVRALPAPVVVDPYGPHGTTDMGEGRRLFAEVGCASCHAPSLGEVRGIYSDLLLHEMGQSLSDSGEYYGFDGPDTPGGPTAGEWRTPPLWGYRDSGPYLHDGRAQTLEEVVALHGGQAAPSARQFFGLTPEEQSRIESFLKSLVAPSSASAPGVVLASELEARIEPDEVRQAEVLVRKQREEAQVLEEQKSGRPRNVSDRSPSRRRNVPRFSF